MKSNLIIRIIKAVGKALQGLKIKSKCCNSECLNNNIEIKEEEEHSEHIESIDSGY